MACATAAVAVVVEEEVVEVVVEVVVEEEEDRRRRESAATTRGDRGAFEGLWLAIAEAAPAIDARDRPRAAAATGAAALGEETMREEGVGAEEANDVDAAVTAVVVAPRAWCRRAAIVFYLLIARFVLVLCSRMLERLLSTLSAREMDGVRKEGEEKRERSKIAFFLFSFRASFLKIQATRCLSFFFFFFFLRKSLNLNHFYFFLHVLDPGPLLPPRPPHPLRRAQQPRRAALLVSVARLDAEPVVVGELPPQGLLVF